MSVSESERVHSRRERRRENKRTLVEEVASSFMKQEKGVEVEKSEGYSGGISRQGRPELRRRRRLCEN